MIKAFISHSSAQKSFVRELEKAIGLDNCIVDERTFESGKLIIDEITKSINKCDIFVFLISKEALASDWVKYELSNIRDLIDDSTFSAFMPFIIDNRVDHSDTGIKPWIRKDYILEKYNSPILLARKIKEKIRELVWNQYPNIQKKETLFKGRDIELGLLDQKYFDGQSEQRRCAIVSGFPPGVGRRRLLKEYIISKVITNKEKTYEPTSLELLENHSIENLIFQLNDLLLMYSNEELLNIPSKTQKIEVAISLINGTFEKKEVVIIRDNGACVLSNGFLSEWFKEIITHPKLTKRLGLFIASRHFINSRVENSLTQIISLQLNPLIKKNAKVLLYAYAEIINARFDTELESAILNNISGIPSLIFRCVDIVKNVPNKNDSLKQILDVVKSEEKSYIAIIEIIRRNQDCYDTLILLAQFEFVSFDIIYNILKDVVEDPDDLLQMLFSYSLFERFGGNNQYIRVNSVVSDYINRERIKLSTKFKTAFEEVVKTFVITENQSQYDLSGYLYGIQQAIKSNITKVDKKYLIPSFTLNVIIETYKAEEYENVVLLCDRFLEDSTNYYEEIVRSIRYWLCSSLCRLQDSRFFEEIDYFEGYSKQFLLGFYHRWKKDYPKAQVYYEDALHQSKENREKGYVAKAKHELVIVKLLLKDYAGALELAQENYESQKTNKYHIEAFFKCLIRSNRPDRAVLATLLSEYDSLALDSKNKTIHRTLKAEFEYYVNKDFPKSVEMLRGIIDEANSKIKYYPYRSLEEITSRRDAKSITLEFKGKYGDELHIVDEDE
ncbi:MAG TPA: toll/interleukin-1 receptor domain-containing protein [Macellibacteroides fermentans]|uniref:TIR domain-containing protein n=1 Tax=Macellibacteroides fermentans TaxID=879969 RepID=UPI002CD20189|nr:toll/interleukin-1 receptor domain-containing protein [Macellibacteroides fermentans]